MLKVDVFSVKGVKLSDFALPKKYEVEVNLNLLAQAKRVYEDSSHFGLRKTKTRSEVIRTKKKLYKQKGTGGARHGSKNAPIFVGGGVAHGPRPISRVLDLPRKMKDVALNMAIALKAKNKELILIDGVTKLEKTKEAANLLNKIAKEGKHARFTFVSSKDNFSTLKFFRNIKNCESISFSNINAYKILMGGLVVIDKNVFEVVKEVKSEKKEKVTLKKTAKKAVKK